MGQPPSSIIPRDPMNRSVDETIMGSIVDIREWVGFNFSKSHIFFTVWFFLLHRRNEEITQGLTDYEIANEVVKGYNTEGRIVLEALILTSAIVFSLIAYTFWALKRGKDFSYLGPILFSCLIILVLTGFIQAFYPLGSTSVAIYGGISAMIFSAYIVYDTDNLIKRFSYDEYIWASVTLYLDILNLFIAILRVLKQGDN